MNSFDNFYAVQYMKRQEEKRRQNTATCEVETIALNLIHGVNVSAYLYRYTAEDMSLLLRTLDRKMRFTGRRYINYQYLQYGQLIAVRDMFINGKPLDKVVEKINNGEI